MDIVVLDEFSVDMFEWNFDHMVLFMVHSWVGIVVNNSWFTVHWDSVSDFSMMSIVADFVMSWDAVVSLNVMGNDWVRDFVVHWSGMVDLMSCGVVHWNGVSNSVVSIMGNFMVWNCVVNSGLMMRSCVVDSSLVVWGNVMHWSFMVWGNVMNSGLVMRSCVVDGSLVMWGSVMCLVSSLVMWGSMMHWSFMVRGYMVGSCLMVNSWVLQYRVSLLIVRWNCMVCFV